MTRSVGVVLMAYGTPASTEDVPAYYTHIRRGHPPTDAQLADLIRRYDALGGASTLAARTEAQRARLAAALDVRADGRFRVEVGNRHAAPFIEDAVASLTDAHDGDGVGELVGLVLAPHYSGFSIGHYAQRLADAADQAGVEATTIHHWYDLDEVVAFHADAVREALAAIGTPEDRVEVVFTAHSLPERLLVDDPYPDELRDGATAIASRADLVREASWSQAWQSAGATDDAWRGPDIASVIADRAARGQIEGIVVCPHGFVADHLEVAYDLDVVARAAAEDAGLAFARTRTLNDDPVVFEALADLVHGAATPA